MRHITNSLSYNKSNTYSFNKKKSINEDYFDSLDNNDDLDSDELSDEYSNDLKDSFKYHEFVDKIIKIVDNIFSEIDSFKYKFYDSANTKYSTLSYNNAVADIKKSRGWLASNYFELPRTDFGNQQRRYEGISKIANIIDSASYQEDSLKHFHLTSYNEAKNIEEFQGSYNTTKFRKCEKRDFITDFAERLIIFKHGLEQLENELGDYKDDDKVLACISAVEVLSEIVRLFRLDADACYNLVFKAESWNKTAEDAQLERTQQLAAITMEYINHNCRQVPDFHLSPLNIPKTIPIISDDANESKELSINRFLFNSSFIDYSLTEFSDQQFKYEISQASKRLQKTVYDYLSTAQKFEKSKDQLNDYSKIVKDAATSDMLYNIDHIKKWHKDILGDDPSDTDLRNFVSTLNPESNLKEFLNNSDNSSIDDLKDLCRNWYLRLFTTYFRFSMLTPNIIKIPSYSRFGVINSMIEKFISSPQSNAWNGNYSIITHQDSFFDDKNTNNSNRNVVLSNKSYAEIIIKYYFDLIDECTTNTDTQYYKGIGASYIPEILAFTELKKTDSPDAVFAKDKLSKSPFKYVFDKRYVTGRLEHANSKEERLPNIGLPTSSTSKLSKMGGHSSSLPFVAEQDFGYKFQNYKNLIKKKNIPASANKSLVGVEKLIHRACTFTNYPYSNDKPSGNQDFSMKDKLNRSFSTDLYNYLIMIRPDLINNMKYYPGLAYTIKPLRGDDPKARPYLLTSPNIPGYSLSTTCNGAYISVRCSLKEFFAESFDELLNAITGFDLYDPYNKIFYHEIPTIFTKRKEFANFLSSSVFSSLKSLLLSRDYSELNYTTDDITKLEQYGPTMRAKQYIGW